LIRRALRDLPKTLDDTYSRLFLEIDEAYREEAINALLWLAFSTRPLLLTELAEAIVINPRTNPPFDPEQRFPDAESVLLILSSLVTISPNDREGDLVGLVTLAHFSVKEYLISDRIRKGPAQYFAISYSVAHYFIAECCLSYVLHYASSATKMGSRQDLSAFPLLKYASERWFTHIKMLPWEQQKLLTPLVLKLLFSADALSSWQLARLLTPPTSFREYVDEGPLYHASSLGLLQVVVELLEAGWDPNSWVNRPPLYTAIVEGHDGVAGLLLKHGANVNAKDHIGYLPLHHAAETGNMSILQMLFTFGAEASPRDQLGETPLHLASYQCHEEIAEYLVKKGAEVEVATTDYLRTPFHVRNISLCPISWALFLTG
jgi:ankyrin repeat domain-containing protein 50